MSMLPIHSILYLRRTASLKRSRDCLERRPSTRGRGDGPLGREEEAVKQQILHARRLGYAAALSVALAVPALAEDKITFADIETLLREHPLPPGPTADIVASRHVDASELQIVVVK